MKLKRNTHKSRVLFVNQRISLSQHKGVNLSQRYRETLLGMIEGKPSQRIVMKAQLIYGETI